MYSPRDAKKLPVLVNIHGGGYGVGDGREDLSKLINANDKAFIGISIQYRVRKAGNTFVESTDRELAWCIRISG